MVQALDRFHTALFHLPTVRLCFEPAERVKYYKCVPFECDFNHFNFIAMMPFTWANAYPVLFNDHPLGGFDCAWWTNGSHIKKLVNE